VGCGEHTGGQAGDLLGEGAGRAGWVVAEEPAHPKPQHHLLPADGGVGQGALVAAVHLGGRVTALGTAGASGAWGDADPQAAAGLLDPVDGYVCQVR
jgi:hypothetical protein